MNKRIFLLAILLISGMTRTMDRYPKISGFVAGTVITASMLEAYHLWCTQKNAEENIPISMPVNTRIRLASCIHVPRERGNGNPPYFEQVEYYNYALGDLAYIYYKNPLEGRTQIYEENREDIKIILNKFSRSPGGLKTEYEKRSYNKKLSLIFSGRNCTNWFDRINCTILLPRPVPQGQKYCEIQIVGNNGSSGADTDVVLYESH